MYQPLETIGNNILNKTAAFEKTIHGSVLRVLRNEVYIQGKMGWFMVGTLVGGNEISIGHSKIVEKYKRLLEDMVKATGSFTVQQRVMADWL